MPPPQIPEDDDVVDRCAVPDDDLWTVEECEEIAEAQYALAQREIAKNPALGIPSYRKGELARRALELANARRIAELERERRIAEMNLGYMEERVRELEEALREIAAMDIATWYDGPSAGFAAVARRALGQEMEG